MDTGSTGVAPVVTGSIGVAPVDTGSIGVAPVDTGSIGVAPVVIGVAPVVTGSIGVAPVEANGWINVAPNTVYCIWSLLQVLPSIECCPIALSAL